MSLIEIFKIPFAAPVAQIGKHIVAHKASRIVLGVLLLIFIIASIGVIIYANNQNAEQKEYFLSNVLPYFAIPGFVLFLPFFYYLQIKTTDIFDEQLIKLREERVEITSKIENDKELDIFNTIQLSLNQLTEYYTINKGQARSSFIFSTFSIIVGLVVIVLGISLSYFGGKHVELSFITGASGVLLEFIGGAYFFMYKKSLEQLNLFFGQLIKIQDTMLAINLTDNVSDTVEKTKLYDKIISSLLERSLK